ncbi:MAG: hypothetical protein U9N42_07750 [Campylobacterota bacterium]|nr:hypothetical protein [Campylobacterota bacterium]
MVQYAQNELLSITEFTKKLASIVKGVKNEAIEKIGILKNNKLEAVLISTAEYERLKQYEALMEVKEDKELIKIVEDRLSKPYETISHADMLKSLNINPEELK